MKRRLKDALETIGLLIAVSLGFGAKHWKPLLIGGIVTTFLVLVWSNIQLRDELTYTEGCLKVVQDNLVRTDLELDEKERDLNNLKNYLQTQQQKGVPHD